jgi:hypothetical protein
MKELGSTLEVTSKKFGPALMEKFRPAPKKFDCLRPQMYGE